MIPLTLSSPSLNRLVLSTSRYSHSLFLSNFNSLSLIHRKLPYKPLFGARCHASSSSSSSSSFTAKSSKEIRKAQTKVVVDEKLSSIRRLFSEPGVGIDAYIIPSQDAHQSEFIAECYARRAYISGFTGSAGTAVVTKDKAALWTDGRYFLQAEKQLNSSWILMRAGNPGVPTASEWIADVLAPGGRVGIDPFLFSADAAEELKEVIAKKNHELVYLYNVNLVDEIWKDSRPKPPSRQIRIHDLKYAGLDVASKLLSLRNQIMDAGTSAIVISMLDEIAWVLNLRGSDVPHSPVMYAYLIVEVDQAQLFVDNSKVTVEVKDHLKNAGIELRPYDSILQGIDSLAARGAQLLMDPSTLNVAIISTYKSACERYSRNFESEAKVKTKFTDSSSGYTANPSGIYMQSPISWAKAIKNDAELKGMKNSHLRDAAALAHFWAWLEEEVHKNANLTEVDVADRLLEFRSMQDGFMDTSFDTISGSGANGAIIHYKPEPESCSRVDPQKLFLLDSGAQYVDGTTDITRTVHFSEPSAREKECFTRVLQGHIALDQAVFPEGTPGFVLDGFARSSLWKIGLDYRHGTGHGVGAALNVHEGPQSISFRYGNMTPLQNGMIVSNEPGYYEDHAFGIRIENLLHVRDAETPNRFGGATYLGFEKLTFFPIQTKMVDVSLLSDTEVDWLNSYHAEVWEKVSPLLEGSTTQQWLWNNTRPLAKP
ncbi:Metallopeptidase M24 family protein [Arabidopsis thaliana]|uniref:Aminopeptidase P2 n=1 Tax=Arabidopsis thaliana TaxID=3702 RepID=AMPP2_ARATH|nr:Metallopeptidase M24 family protein [Arabidopsis thaliana]Q8RY11.1 RecName: Full=Aminopeptidase P2; Short=AtAPP2; Flags: Precursor [Arabidopsis thaliana]AAL84973.1 AT3g05350/T12H1_32 [Arabidopsis thaliana]AAN46861.1 At3g05350/T12H1_32 [Arabidopsis thaliana]AEE74224.1 Metallopeptidase M24 family protein [Arabidopsis thaliana]|eukprot:NP_187186.5 Metallopeptidase M24 family protein [Arabidopsis thaliana]